jgi:sugar phosphate permease
MRQSMDKESSLKVPSHQDPAEKGEILPDDVAVTANEDNDVVLAFITNLDPAIKDEPISAKEYRRVRWKIDLCILPLMAGTTILAAVDKNVIGNTAILGILEDANLTGLEFSWIGSLFFFGYLIFEWPMAYLIQRFPVAKLLSVTVMGWAILAMCMAATHNFAGLAVVRFPSKHFQALGAFFS